MLQGLVKLGDAAEEPRKTRRSRERRTDATGDASGERRSDSGGMGLVDDRRSGEKCREEGGMSWIKLCGAPPAAAERRSEDGRRRASRWQRSGSLGRGLLGQGSACSDGGTSRSDSDDVQASVAAPASSHGAVLTRATEWGAAGCFAERESKMGKSGPVRTDWFGTSASARAAACSRRDTQVSVARAQRDVQVEVGRRLGDAQVGVSLSRLPAFVGSP